MKLYKLFENIILREVGEPLTGNVSDKDVIDAINGKYFVNITYDDYPDENPSVTPSKRYIQVYNFSDTTANNKAIRAYQAGGGSKTTPGRGAWKIFRLDRIRSWQPTKMKFYSPVDKFNPNGDRTMKTVHNIATFDDKYKTSKYKRKSTDITPDVVANMSPEEKAKYVASITKSQDKFRVKKPEIVNQPKTTGVEEPAYIDKSDNDNNTAAIDTQQSVNNEPNDNTKSVEDIAYLAKKEKQRQDRQEKLRAKIEKEKELKKRLQQKLKQKNNNTLKTKTDDNTTTSRP